MKNSGVNNNSGIYKITNLVNGKVYVGKTVNFRKRYNVYKSAFNKQDVRKINEYFLNSMNKHGIDNFLFGIIEECPIYALSERELYWIEKLSSTKRKFGYNLRLDSSTGMITHEETKKKISERVKKEYADGTRDTKKTSKFFKEYWKNPDNLNKMRKNLSESKSSFFIQRNLDDEIIRVWKSINQILELRKDYKWQNIYAACNGSKNSYKGYKWQRTKDISEIDESLIVQDDYTFEYMKTRNKVTCAEYIKHGQHKVRMWYFITHQSGEVEKLAWNEFKKRYPHASSKFSRLKSDKIEMYGVQIERVVNEQD